MSSYDIGDVAGLRMTLRDPETGQLANTGSVTLVVRHPDLSETTPAIANPSTGVYTANVPVDAAGTWRYEFTGTGDIEASESGAFVVKARWSTPVPWLPDLADVAAYVPVRATPAGVGDQVPLGTFTEATTPNDDQVRRIIAAAAAHVAGRLGTVVDGLFDQAKDCAAMRAAGFVELAFPQRDDDVNTAETLLREAKADLDALAAVNTSGGGGNPGDPSNLLPVYSFPAARPNLDTYPTY